MTPEEVIKKTQSELNDHKYDHKTGWEKRFCKYVSQSVANIEDIIRRRKKFHKWGYLSVYYTLGRAQNNSGVFDLRYQGQSVGEIHIDKKGNVKLQISNDQYQNNCNEKYLNGYPKAICKQGSYDWNSYEAKTFRSYFNSNPGKSGHPEHKYENLLLREFSEKSSKTKSFTRIQPVTIGTKTDLFFQMPTPLTASGTDVLYSNGHGGIDILARKNGRLTIIELKDEFKSTEGPEKVINQAIAYATFIVELCNTTAKDDFWKLCGFNRKPNDNEILNVAILMPDPDGKTEPEFAGKNLNIPGSNMQLELHYIFFDKETFKITRHSFKI